jgi:hypothetical protein
MAKIQNVSKQVILISVFYIKLNLLIIDPIVELFKTVMICFEFFWDPGCSGIQINEDANTLVCGG